MEWFVRCVTDKYADFQGRAHRTEFWMFFAIYFAAIICLVIVSAILGAAIGDVGSLIGSVLIGLFALAMIIPNLAVTVRRLHDQNMSGWLVLLACLCGLIPLVMAALPGTTGPNQYGPEPQ